MIFRGYFLITIFHYSHYFGTKILIIMPSSNWILVLSNCLPTNILRFSFYFIPFYFFSFSSSHHTHLYINYISQSTQKKPRPCRWILCVCVFFSFKIFFQTSSKQKKIMFPFHNDFSFNLFSLLNVFVCVCVLYIFFRLFFLSVCVHPRVLFSFLNWNNSS